MNQVTGPEDASRGLVDPNGNVWRETGYVRNGESLYVIDGVDLENCPRTFMSTQAELEEDFGAELVPLQLVQRLSTLGEADEWLTGVGLSLREERLESARLRLALKSAQRGRSRLRARVAELESELWLEVTAAGQERGARRFDEVALRWCVGRLQDEVDELRAERHSTNEALRACRDRIDELEALTPAHSQTCRKCGAGYTYGEPCSSCQFRSLMADALQARDQIVAYAARNTDRPDDLLCREHGDLGGWRRLLTPLTSEDLPDGGVCTWKAPGGIDQCGRDVLTEPESGEETE